LSQAQDDNGLASTVRWFYSACEDRMVVDLEGSMQAGYDLYYQAFDRFGGLGDPLTELTRVAVDGERRSARADGGSAPACTAATRECIEVGVGGLDGLGVEHARRGLRRIGGKQRERAGKLGARGSSRIHRH